MKNAEEKLRELVKKTIEIAEADSYMPYTIDMLLGILEPSDLMEIGYEEYLKEYLEAYEENITDELKADIEAAIRKRHDTGEKRNNDDRPPETLAEYMRRSDPIKLQRDVLQTTGEIIDVLAPILKAVLAPVLSSEN